MEPLGARAGAAARRVSGQIDDETNARSAGVRRRAVAAIAWPLLVGSVTAALVLIALSVPALAEEGTEFHDPWRLDPVASPTFQSVDLHLDPGERNYSGSIR